ncbi:MAG: two-component system, OmpR family, alkaline phosphatase synthesis response regulator PhoP [Blastocatellia bacterium]|jgi:DNA-binding response OmpR family regulator|nr:two-component system, OmpR family, alkaline phosphatase synthesis response regulator PhoP [Blastocatellia bacterium]
MSLAENAIRDGQVQSQSADDVYDDGYLRIEHRNYYMACGGQSIRLPRTEFLIISRLAHSVERAVSAEELWLYARGNEKPLNAESLHVFMYRLRSKLLPYELHIDTVVNVGYRLLLPEPSRADQS